MKMFAFARPISSAPVARQRLQMLLDYERRTAQQPDLITLLHGEILAIVSRYVTIDHDKVQVSVNRGPKVSILAVDVEIPNLFRLGTAARF